MVASGVESNRHVFRPVLIKEKQATKKYTLGIECRTGGPIGTDDVRLQLLHPVLPSSRSVECGRGPFASSCHCRVTGMTDVHVQFIELQ